MATCMRRLLSVQSKPVSRLVDVPAGRNDRTPERGLEQARPAHCSAERAGVQHPQALGFSSDDCAPLAGMLRSRAVTGPARKFTAPATLDAEPVVERKVALDGAERFRRLAGTRRP